MFIRVEKSNFGFTRGGRIFCGWLTILIRFEDDGSRKVGSGSVRGATKYEGFLVRGCDRIV